MLVKTDSRALLLVSEFLIYCTNSGMDCGICLSNKFPNDADAVSLGTRFEEPLI